MLVVREVRLAEVVAVLSLGADLGLGQLMQHVMKPELANRILLEFLARERVPKMLAM